MKAINTTIRDGGPVRMGGGVIRILRLSAHVRPACLAALLLLIGTLSFTFTTRASVVGAVCTGHFVNPITDICWECLFPLTIGEAEIVPGDRPDTPNPVSPVCICPIGVGFRVGLNFGYWEPTALTDVTRAPFCMVNLGGVQMSVGNLDQDIGESNDNNNPSGVKQAFYWVHWYKYPLMYWLNILTDVGCLQSGNMDVAYLSEVDPTWNDDSLTFIENPEAVLFGSAIAQTACIADALKTTTGFMLPIDALFWCLGSQGGAYPLDGTVAAQVSHVQAATLLSERLAIKLHRMPPIVWDTNPVYTCFATPTPIMPKSRYRYQMVNTLPDVLGGWPFGTTTILWEAGHSPPVYGSTNFGFLIWRKRNCCYL